MAQTSNNGPASLGTLGASSLLFKAPILAIISEWVSVLPLVFYFTSYYRDYDLLGRVALTGQVPATPCAESGTIEGLTRLLTDGGEFSDRASITPRSSHMVWDVNWGSTFPCANGAASAIIARYALQREPHVVNVSAYAESYRGATNQIPASQPSRTEVSESPPPRGQFKLLGTRPGSLPGFPPAFKLSPTPFPPRPPSEKAAFESRVARSSHRRYQRLNVFHFSRTRPRVRYRDGVGLFAALVAICFLMAVILLSLYGLYGTAAALLGSSISKLASRFICLHRPREYLSSNEAHDACMLVGVHSNCSTWQLYIGDRGVVDNLLNKSLINTEPSPAHPFRSMRTLILLLRAGHVSHFLATTFVAAQKGWDGVAMIMLMLIAWSASEYFSSDGRIAKEWLNDSGVEVKARRFDFEGRMQMIGAIQMLSGSERINWMDSIVVPHPRREALFRELGVIMKGESKAGEERVEGVDGAGKGGRLESFDENWVALQAGLVVRAAKVMLEELARA